MKHFKDYDQRIIAPRGLIVLDISIVTNLQKMFLASDSIRHIAIEANARIARFHVGFKSALGYRRDERILGILTFAKFLGYHRLANNHINCQASQIFIHAKRGRYEAILAEDFYRCLLPGPGNEA
jgi:hypothetical protein